MFAPTDEKELNPGGSHRPVSSDLNKEIRRYAKLGNHVKRYRFSNKYVKDKKVLEIGCGYGFGSIFLKGYIEYVGVDVDLEAIEWAKKNINGGTFFAMDEFQKTHNEDSFDVVIAFEVIEHVKDPVEFLGTLKKYCKHNGIIIVSTPNGYYSDHIWEKFRTEFHIDEYSLPEFQTLIKKAGLNATFYKEYRFDRLDSYWLQKMKDTKIEEWIRLTKTKGSYESVSNFNNCNQKEENQFVVFRFIVNLFNVAYNFFNSEIFWHIRRIESSQKGYSTIIAFINKG